MHRDIKDTTVGTLSQRITNQLMGLKGLHSHIRDIDAYVGKVVAGKLPINHQVNKASHQVSVVFISVDLSWSC